jgi:hypothetical protein
MITFITKEEFEGFKKDNIGHTDRELFFCFIIKSDHNIYFHIKDLDCYLFTDHNRGNKYKIFDEIYPQLKIIHNRRKLLDELR